MKLSLDRRMRLEISETMYIHTSEFLFFSLTAGVLVCLRFPSTRLSVMNGICGLDSSLS